MRGLPRSSGSTELTERASQRLMMSGQQLAGPGAHAPALRRAMNMVVNRNDVFMQGEAGYFYPEVKNVTTAYTDATVTKRFLSSDGHDLRWSLVRSVAQAHFTAKRDGQLAGRSTRVGATKGWELFTDEDPVAIASRPRPSAASHASTLFRKVARSRVANQISPVRRASRAARRRASSSQPGAETRPPAPTTTDSS